jgi:hypothetical protein
MAFKHGQPAGGLLYVVRGVRGVTYTDAVYFAQGDAWTGGARVWVEGSRGSANDFGPLKDRGLISCHAARPSDESFRLQGWDPGVRDSFFFELFSQ